MRLEALGFIEGHPRYPEERPEASIVPYIPPVDVKTLKRLSRPRGPKSFQPHVPESKVETMGPSYGPLIWNPYIPTILHIPIRAILGTLDRA